MNVLLVRYAYLPTVTLGLLYVANRMFATLEEPWVADPAGPGGQRRELGKQESCAPDGIYILEPHNGPKFQDVWALVNPALGVYHGSIPTGSLYGRSDILIHNGNTTDDTEGCILIGLTHGRLNGKDAVLGSQTALESLRSILGRGTHQLTIRPIAGTAEVNHG